MKVAHINLFFKLPDDFDGGVDEVLKAIQEYRKDHGKEPKSMPIVEELENSSSISKSGYDKLILNKFVSSIDEGYHSYGTIDIFDLDEK